MTHPPAWPATPPHVRPLLRPLLRALLALGAGLIATHGIGVGIDWVDVASAPDSSDYRAAMRGEGVRMIVQLVVLLVLAVLSFAVVGVLAALTARARRNAELISPRPHRLGPGMAAGGWFIPVANAVLPWQAVTDVWLASDPATRFAPPGAGPRSVSGVSLWWGSSIALGIVTAALTIAMPRPVITYDPRSGTILNGLDEYRSALTATAAANSVLAICWTVVAVLTYRVFRQIVDWQDEAAAPSPPVVPVPATSMQSTLPDPSVVTVPPDGLAWPHPGSPPPPPGWMPRPPSGLAIAVIVTVLAWALTPVQVAAGVEQVITSDLRSASVAQFISGLLTAVVLMVAAGVLTMIWQAQARTFAIRVAGTAAVPAGWTVAAWVIPVVNLAVPAWLTYRLLQPAGTGRPGHGDIALVTAWWITWLSGWTSTWIAFAISLDRPDVQAATLPSAAWTAAGIWAVSAVLFAVIVALVRRRQSQALGPAAPPRAHRPRCDRSLHRRGRTGNAGTAQ